MQPIMKTASSHRALGLEWQDMDKLREPLEDMGCGLPPALEVMGERWSFLILRAVLNGLYHFEDILGVIGIARNILSNRLGKLVENGILERQPMADDRRKVRYALTPKGMDLLPALLSLRQWGEKYGQHVPSNPVLVDARDCLPIGQIVITAHDGRVLTYEDLQWVDRLQVGNPDADGCC